MLRNGYLVIALGAILFTIFLGRSSTPNVLPAMPSANAATLSMTLTGCFVVTGPCINVGWNGTTSKPNPTITVQQGDAVSIQLSSNDGAPHRFLFDVDNDGAADTADCGTTDPCSLNTPTTFMFTVSATPATYTYFCTFHPAQMKGSIIVNPSGSVGGVSTPVNKTALAAPYLAIASIFLVAIIVTTIFIRRARREPESN